MALQGSQTSQSGRLCLPLLKFSYADVPTGSIGPIPWTHLSSQGDLFVLLIPFESSSQTGAAETHYRFKVLQDPNAHEDLDLFLLANEARRAISEVQNSQIPTQQPSITVVVRNPCLAMRYPLSNGQVRRFQVRFAKEEDFYETLKICAMMKIPLVEAGSGSTQRTAPAPAVQPAFVHNAFNNRELNNAERQGFRLTDTQNHIANPQMTNQNATQVLHNTYGAVTTPYQSSIQSYNPNSYTTAPVSNIAIDGRPATAIPAFQNTQTAFSTIQTASQAPIIPHTLLETPLTTYVPRPSSTAPLPSPKSAASELPPKRDLPFTRKSKQPIAPATTGLAAAEAEETTRPANQPKKPTAAKKKTSVPTRRKRPATRSQDAVTTASLEEPQENNNEETDGASLNRPQIDTQELIDRADALKAARDRQRANQPGVTAKDDARPNIQLHNNHNNSGNLDTTHLPTKPTSELQPQFVNDTTNTTNPVPVPVNVNATSTPHESSHSHSQTDLNPSFTAPAFTTKKPYHALSEAEQHAFLESFVVQNVQDEEFWNLCRRMEGVWQRIFC